ncbi:titin-like [Artemia franciscana]|uniref:titin-like n=1 Tax=Artemia franciscana TaxID=6661 RepID=UPI0032DA0B3F
MTIVTKTLVAGTLITCAGISISWALGKYTKLITDSKEHRNSPSHKKNALKPINEDKMTTAPASKECVQTEQDFKLDVVTPMQSNNEKNSQAVQKNHIHQNPPYNPDSESSLTHTAKVFSKRLGQFPLASVLDSVEPPLKSSEPAPKQPILINGVTEEPMVPEKQLEEKPIPDIEIGEPSVVPIQDITVPSPLPENTEIFEVAAVSCSPVLDSEVLSNPVMPVDPTVVPLPTIVVEPPPVPERSVTALQVSITKQQNTDVAPDVEEKTIFTFQEQPSLTKAGTEEQMVPEKQLEEKPIEDIEIEESSVVPIQDITVPLPLPENTEIFEVAKVSCSPVLDSELLSNPVMPVDPTVEPLPTIVVEPPPVPETSIAAPQVSITRLQNTDVEPDEEEKKISTFPERPSLTKGGTEEHMVPEKELEEKPIPDIEIEESSMVPIQDITILSSLPENTETFEVAEVSCSSVLDSEILSDPVMPVNPIVVSLPTIVVEPTPAPGTSVAAPEVITKIQNTDVETDVEEKTISTFPDQASLVKGATEEPMVPGKQLEDKRITDTKIEEPSVVLIQGITVPSPLPENTEMFEVAEVSCSPELDSELLSNPVMPIDSIVEHLPTIVVEPPPVPETSVAAPEVPITKLQNTDVEPDVAEKKKSTFPEQPSLVKGATEEPIVSGNQLEEKPIPDIEIEEPSAVPIKDISVPSPLPENTEMFQVAEVSCSPILDSQIQSGPVMPTDPVVVPLPNIVLEPLPLLEKPTATTQVSNLGVMKDWSGSLPQALHSERKGNASKKLSPESNVDEAVCFARPILRFFESLPAVQTFPVSETSVAVPEVLIPTPQSGNVEPSAQEDMRHINWQNWFQVETSVAAPEVSNLANASKKNSSESNLDAWKPLQRIFMESKTDEAISFGGPIRRFLESQPILQSFKDELVKL